MPVTREPNFPAETARLALALGHTAHGSPIRTVVEAAGQFLVMAIVNYARLTGKTHAELQDIRDGCFKAITAEIECNWNRKPRPTDVKVELSS
jgi:hypothetical protein